MRYGGKKFDTDRVAKEILLHLLSDFRRFEQALCPGLERAIALGPKTFRCYNFPELGHVDASRFKMIVQLRDLLKKYRFRDDYYDDEELRSLTTEKWIASQTLLSRPMKITACSFAVLQRARQICRGILGKTPPFDDVINLTRFGKRASIGSPFDRAYLDLKLTDPDAYSCTSVSLRWFMEHYIKHDKVLNRVLCAGKEPRHVDWLKLAFVPKSWKTERPITPLSLLGLFLSHGIGSVVESRLSSVGLNIKTLQQRHQLLAKVYSRTRSHVTADLSNASNSLTRELLMSVLPRAWYNCLKQTFVSQTRIGAKDYYTVSCLPMGNGATFPIETTVFYCLIKAIGELLGVEGVYSVYGDDLIYPRKIHRYVAGLFPHYNISINTEKTYASSHFRESCGGDYYRGTDVRPAILPGQHQLLTRTRYLAYLYKCYNGLCRRWGDETISGTLTYLLREIVQLSDVVHQIPESYPDTAGVKTAYIRTDWNIPWAPVITQFHCGSRWYVFEFLLERAERRYVTAVEPYYWLSVRRLSDDLAVKVDPERTAYFDRRRCPVRSKMALEYLGPPPVLPDSMYAWHVTYKGKPMRTKSGRPLQSIPVRLQPSRANNWRKVVRYQMTVTSKTESVVEVKKVKAGSISDWI